MGIETKLMPSWDKNCYRHDLVTSRKGGHYLVNTDFQPARGLWVTTVYRCDEQGIVSNWDEIDIDMGSAFVAMHDRMVDIWGTK